MTDNDKAVIDGLRKMGFRYMGPECPKKYRYNERLFVKYMPWSTGPAFRLFLTNAGELVEIRFHDNTPPTVILAAVKAAIESEAPDGTFKE